MLLRKFEMPWRTTYESYAALAWLCCGLGMAYLHGNADVPRLPFKVLLVTSAVFFLVNAARTWKIWRLKFALGGKGIAFISDGDLAAKLEEKPNYMWVGKGFEWTPVHTQRVYEIKRADPTRFYPPDWVMWCQEQWSGDKVAARSEDSIGAPWIHGLNGDEEDQYVAVENFVGNTIVLGTTRCGKTRWLELIAEMAILLGYCVICVEPKGDKEFEASLRAACKFAGREADYVRMHLAFPGDSCRLDPLKNYNNPSDLASRISALMPGGDKSSSFRDFAWGVLNAINLGMLFVGEKPTLMRIRSYVDNGVADLLLRVLLKYLDENLPPTWEQDVAAFAKTLPKAKGKAGQDDGDILVRQSLNLLLAYYQDVLVANGHQQEALQALSTIYKHDAAHYGKMIANLVPILGMLTTGDLGKLLSPDPMDVDDPRPMTDLYSLIKSNAVAYLGLDSLANKTLASAVGSLLLSDATSVAAALYNFGDKPIKTFLIVDELSVVANDPYIEMLNKSAGAGFINVAAAQTVPDLARRFESMDAARQMLGNFNNVFAMRIKCGITQEFVAETFGETYVYTKQVIQGSSSDTASNLAHFTGNVVERVTESMEEIFPQDLLGQLPNWQYVAAVSGGRMIKGRLPIIMHGGE